VDGDHRFCIKDRLYPCDSGLAHNQKIPGSVRVTTDEESKTLELKESARVRPGKSRPDHGLQPY